MSIPHAPNDDPSFDELERQLDAHHEPVEWDPEQLKPGDKLFGTLLELEAVERSSRDGDNAWTERWLRVQEKTLPFATRVKIAGAQAKGWLEANEQTIRPGRRVAVRFDGMTSKTARDGKTSTWPEFTIKPDVRDVQEPPPDPQDDDITPEPGYVPAPF